MEINTKKCSLIGLSLIVGLSFLDTFSRHNVLQEDVYADNSLIDLTNIYDDGEYVYKPSKQVTFIEAVEDFKISLDKYKETNDIKDLKDAICRFGEVPKVSKIVNNTLLKNSMELNTYFKELRAFCYDLSNESEREECVVLLAEETFLGWKYKKDATYFRDEFLIENIINYNKSKMPSIQAKLNYLIKVIRYYDDFYDPYPGLNIIPDVYFGNKYKTDTDNFPDEDDVIPPNQGIVFDKDTTDDDKYKDGPTIEPPDSDTDSGVNKTPVTDNTLVSSYKKEGNKCYKVEYEYVNGKKNEKRKTLADKSDYSYCGIYDYINFASSSNNARIDKDYLLENQNKESEYFLYYTINANSKKPYYYNSGIRADKNNKTLSFNQLRDGIYQMMSQVNAFAIDDNSKSLYILNGKPIVIRKGGSDAYTESDINNMLKNYPMFKVKIQKESTDDKDSTSV